MTQIEIDDIATDIAVMRGSQERRDAIIKLINRLQVKNLNISAVIKSVCPVCGGNGQVQQTDIDWDDCRRCNGTGQIVL